jgi:hypothetical protein
MPPCAVPVVDCGALAALLELPAGLIAVAAPTAGDSALPSLAGGPALLPARALLPSRRIPTKAVSPPSRIHATACG